ncbi:hypothetical protein HAX54_044789 [Datura stramonium]|uniref:Uncharacterized protein n=1 Tax=Datura stramonium TaxID=4076 RepID=A0ABS8WIW1_DATST|nr:hypothetical protein [Datura stramonium]
MRTSTGFMDKEFPFTYLGCSRYVVRKKNEFFDNMIGLEEKGMQIADVSQYQLQRIYIMSSSKEKLHNIYRLPWNTTWDRPPPRKDKSSPHPFMLVETPMEFTEDSSEHCETFFLDVLPNLENPAFDLIIAPPVEAEN